VPDRGDPDGDTLDLRQPGVLAGKDVQTRLEQAPARVEREAVLQGAVDVGTHDESVPNPDWEVGLLGLKEHRERPVAGPVGLHLRDHHPVGERGHGTLERAWRQVIGQVGRDLGRVATADDVVHQLRLPQRFPPVQ
jgi:hypothetical protein